MIFKISISIFIAGTSSCLPRYNRLMTGVAITANSVDAVVMVMDKATLLLAK